MTRFRILAMYTYIVPFALTAALLGCGNAAKLSVDAAVQSDAAIDAMAMVDAAPATGCAGYCISIMTACTGANAQYSDAATCMATCAKWLPGLPGQDLGNTVACRATHAGRAMTLDPATYCIYAGPAGGDNSKPGTPAGAVCGTACESFCKVAVASCGTQYPSESACVNACAGFTPGLKYSAAIQTGPTLACRIYHLTVATVSPAPHCLHTAITPTAPCL
jgi:hypothetical protein